MRILEQGIDSESDILAVLTAGSATNELEIEAVVREICQQVQRDGDQALLELGQRFDSGELSSIEVDASEIEAAFHSTPPHITTALQRAASNIHRFHEAEKQSSWMTLNGGSTLGQIVRPMESVGIYVPGGKAAYPSTVLMTAIPAAVAGVERVAVATPVAADGSVPRVVLAACHLCGVKQVYKMGGAQALAAFAYGTATVQRVDKVVGPGNQYVNVAKRLLFGRIGVDSLAGPSEVLIIADASVPADWIAADLMAQAEHGAESKSIVITWSRVLADKILSSIGALCRLEPRSEWISQSLAARGALIVVEDEVEALRLTNLCAPEHLQLLVGNPQEWIGRVRHAGAIFAGSYSPVPLGDYAAGPSHTLPTGTSARFSSALGVAEFQKRTSLIWYDKNEYAEDAKAAVTLAEAEGLHAHATSLRLRMAED